MTEFQNMWKNFANFSDRTTVRGYWMAFLFNIIAMFAVAIVTGILVGLIGAGFWAIYVIYCLAMIVPYLALTVRRLKDAGKPWFYIFVSAIPIAGIFIYIYFLIQPSVPADGTPVV